MNGDGMVVVGDLRQPTVRAIVGVVVERGRSWPRFNNTSAAVFSSLLQPVAEFELLPVLQLEVVGRS